MGNPRKTMGKPGKGWKKKMLLVVSKAGNSWGLTFLFCLARKLWLEVPKKRWAFPPPFSWIELAFTTRMPLFLPRECWIFALRSSPLLPLTFALPNFHERSGLLGTFPLSRLRLSGVYVGRTTKNKGAPSVDNIGTSKLFRRWQDFFKKKKHIKSPLTLGSKTCS